MQERTQMRCETSCVVFTLNNVTHYYLWPCTLKKHIHCSLNLLWRASNGSLCAVEFVFTCSVLMYIKLPAVHSSFLLLFQLELDNRWDFNCQWLKGKWLFKAEFYLKFKKQLLISVKCTVESLTCGGTVLLFVIWERSKFKVALLPCPILFQRQKIF